LAYQSLVNELLVGGTIALAFSNAFLDFGSDTVIKENDIAFEEFFQFLSDGLEGVLFRALAIGTAEMRHQSDCFGMVIDAVLDGWQGSNNALVICDLVGSSFLLGDLASSQLPISWTGAMVIH
jgi:hypothetical protein